MLSKVLHWVKDLPSTVKTLIGLITTAIPAIILLRANFNLGVVVLLAIIALACLSSLAYIILAKNEPVAGFSPMERDKYKFPRHRRWAAVGMCVVAAACILLFALRPSRYYILAALKGMEVAPRADILIAQFDARLASKKFELPNRIKANLEEQLRKHNLRDVGVEITSQVVTSPEGAESLIQQAAGKVLIWGWYDDLGITVKIYAPEQQRSLDEDVLRMKEIAWAQGSQGAGDISLKIRERLPEDITFLSLFIVGSLDYRRNEYQKGHQAFDAAMSSMPKDIGLENESLLHFFSARSIKVNNAQDAEDAICEYSKAIEMNPNFAAAYNNLGILTTDLINRTNPQAGESDESGSVATTSDAMSECLHRAGFEYHDITNETTSFFFDKAIAAQPDSAVIQFNRLASVWSMWNSFDDSDTRDGMAEMLDKLLSKDRSIPGAHIMRGVLAFENEGKAFDKRQAQIALQEFSAASQLLPKSPELHVNMGKVHIRTGQYTDAQAEFEKALSLAKDSPEAHLALADLALRQGRPDLALQHLSAVRHGDASAVRAGDVLQSLIEFDVGDVAKAIQTLETDLQQGPKPKQEDGPAANIPLRNDNSLIHYLLALLYKLNSDIEKTKSHVEECRDTGWGNSEEDMNMRMNLRDQAQSYNDTATVAWCDLLSLCASGGLNISKPTSGKQCLPQDTSQRIKKVFDITQDRIAYRIFYRRKVEFAGLG